MLLGEMTMLVAQTVARLLPVAAGQSPTGLLGVSQGLWKWLIITGLIGGLTIALLDGVCQRFKRQWAGFDRMATFSRALTDILIAGLYVIICGLVFFGAARLFGFEQSRAIYGGLIYGVAFGVVFGFRARRQSQTSDINTTEQFGFAPAGILPGLVLGALCGLVVGFGGGLIIGLISGAGVGVSLGAIMCVSGCVLGALIGGLKVSAITDDTLLNHGISMALKNTGLLWLVVGTMFVLVFLACAKMTIGITRAALEMSLFFGFVVGLLVSFSYCGFDVIYHYALRLVLALNNYTPFNYRRFLDYAYQLTFLRFIRGRYEFKHPVFQKYLTDLNAPTDTL